MDRIDVACGVASAALAMALISLVLQFAALSGKARTPNVPVTYKLQLAKHLI